MTNKERYLALKEWCYARKITIDQVALEAGYKSAESSSNILRRDRMSPTARKHLIDLGVPAELLPAPSLKATSKEKKEWKPRWPNPEASRFYEPTIAANT